MRPVSKDANPAGYSPPATLRFLGRNAATIQAVLGTNNPTLAACLDVWLRVVKARKRNPKPKWFNSWEAAAQLIQGRVDEIYKEAAGALMTELGEYCSYCESRITGLMEVEHVLSKAEFPTLATSWENFLLACGACNTCKGNTPRRPTVRRWLGMKITNETQCETEVRRRYYWPDKYPGSYRALPVEMSCDTTGAGNWQIIPLADATHLNTVLVSVDIPTRTVRANIPTMGMNNVRVIVRVTPQVTQVNQGGAQMSVTPKGAQELIDLCGLNTTRSSRAAYDRRGISRTRAWFSALDALRTLYSSPTQADFDRTWQQVGQTAAGIGFFSVWMRVFSSATDLNGTQLDERFVNEFTGLFPGTDVTLLP